MMRFYDLDKIVCWDLSWGIWEAVRDDGETCDDAWLPEDEVREGREGGRAVPALRRRGWGREIQGCNLRLLPARGPRHPALAETLGGVSGYYLVCGNTYTMSLFHNIWDRQGLEDRGIGHMQLLRDTLS